MQWFSFNSLDNLSDVPEDLKDSLEQFRTQRKDLEARLRDAKQIQAQINSTKGHLDFRTPEEIHRIVSDIESKISQSEKIEAEIEEVKSNPLYLDPDEIKVCQKMIDETLQLNLV